MKAPRLMLFAIVPVMLAFVPSPAPEFSEASLAAGCNAAGPGSVVLWVADGVEVGRISGANAALSEGMVAAELDRAWKKALVCREEVAPVTGEIVANLVLHTISADSFQRVAELYLSSLVLDQNAYRESTGGWMVGPTAELRRHGQISELSVAFGLASTISVGDSGWSATVLAEDLGTVCHVLAGEFAAPREGLEPGVPKCFSTGMER